MTLPDDTGDPSDLYGFLVDGEQTRARRPLVLDSPALIVIFFEEKSGRITATNFYTDPAAAVRAYQGTEKGECAEIHPAVPLTREEVEHTPRYTRRAAEVDVHIIAPEAGDDEPDRVDGWTKCGTPMRYDERWVDVHPHLVDLRWVHSDCTAAGGAGQ